MEIYRKYFNHISTDNEENYFSMLFGIIESVDELSYLQITKINDGYTFRISPSTPQYNNPLIEELLKFHNMLGIRLDLSKSIKSSGTLSYKIKL